MYNIIYFITIKLKIYSELKDKFIDRLNREGFWYHGHKISKKYFIYMTRFIFLCKLEYVLYMQIFLKNYPNYFTILIETLFNNLKYNSIYKNKNVNLKSYSYIKY